jgi:hypothetical protein
MTRRWGAGGRKEAWDEGLRADATEYAERRGAAAAAAKFKVPVGTVRSWLARARRKREEREVSDDLIAQIKAEGAAIVARLEGRSAEEKAAAETEYERKRLAKLRWVEASPEERESMERPD